MEKMSMYSFVMSIKNPHLRTFAFTLWKPWGHLKSAWFKLKFLLYLARLWWFSPEPEGLRYAQCRFGDRLYIFSHDRPILFYRVDGNK
jgi:hypothetical protein